MLIDLDPQSGLTKSLGLNPRELEDTIYEPLATPKVSLSQVLHKEVFPKADLAPSNMQLAGVEALYGTKTEGSGSRS